MSCTKEQYELNPKHCAYCGAILPYEKRYNTYCNRSCAQHARKHLTPEEEKLHRQIYMKKYMEDHKEERAEYKADYYAKNKDEILLKNKQYRLEHADQIKAQKRESRKINGYGKEICAVCGEEFIKRGCKQRICKKCRAIRAESLGLKSTTYHNTRKGSAHRIVLKEAGILTEDLIRQGYAVHHMDGNRRNNELDNLVTLKLGDHTRLHTLINNEWIDHQSMTLRELSELVIAKYNIPVIRKRGQLK